jgi:sulfotransferase family protein
MRTAEHLVARAVSKTGLEDFGTEDWREGLERLVSSLVAEAGLTELGEKMTAFRLRRLLENRLRVEDTFRRHPEIELEHIEAPVFIIGLPRTGTTALSNLIAQDPEIRSLRLWESLDPVPAPMSETEHTDPRIAATQAGLDVMDQVYPRMKALYPQTATGPTECQDLLGMAFRTSHFDGMARVPAYMDWVLGADMRPAYEYHRRTLKLLQWRCPPKRWHLKTPVHTLALDALDSVYPDARFIWTHRDPAEVIGSVCSLITYLRAMVSDRDDRAEIATQQIELWVEALRRGTAFRAMAGEERFADVRHEDLARDGVGAVRGAYERLGMELGEGTAEAMRGWLASHPRGAHGSHSYDLSEYGIDAETVRARFAVYEP